MSILLLAEVPADVADSVRQLALASDVPFEVIVLLTSDEFDPDASEQIRVVRSGNKDDSSAGAADDLNLLTASAKYATCAFTSSLGWLTPDVLSGLVGAGPAALTVLCDERASEPVEALQAGAGFGFPTALGRAIHFRSNVPTATGSVPLVQREDIWVDYLVRLLCFAPLDLTRLEVHSAGSPLFSRRQLDVPPGISDQEALRWIADNLAVACATGSDIRDASPRAAHVCRELLRDSAQRANLMLRSKPDLHISVIDVLRRNRVWQFPYSELNAGLARRLVIAYGYPPFTDTSGLVFARRTLERAQVVDVVSKDLTGRARYDEQALAIVEEFVASQVLIDGPTSFDDWSAISHYCQAGLAAIEELSGGAEYEQIYSRAMWPASHFLAAIYKLMHPDTEWIAEFSDPMRRDPSNGTRHAAITDDVTSRQLTALLSPHGISFPEGDDVYGWTEDLPYRFADQILFTNAQQREFVMSYCDPAFVEPVMEKSTFEHHPSPPPSFYRYSGLDLELDPELVHVGYFGVFYPTRGLKSIAEAIVSLPKAQQAQLRLHVFCPRPIEMEQMAAEADLQSVIVAHPYLAYFDFLSAITQFDCLLVDDFRTSSTHPINPYLPSKWSDYVGSGTPIWRVTEPGSVLSQMRAAYKSDLDDVAGARRALDEILEIGPRQQHSANVKR